jgi:abortive infection bacteriophage resistance protein
MINHTDKKFLTFNQQIDHLIALGLNILNKNRLLKYLKKYNYENIINEFAYIFRESDGVKFKKNITDEDIIFLFNFDQSIRMNILSAIFTIEKHLNTSIAYYICQNKEYT